MKSVPEPEHHRQDGRRIRGGVGIGHEIQFRNVGGESQNGWRFSGILRGVRVQFGSTMGATASSVAAMSEL